MAGAAVLAACWRLRAGESGGRFAVGDGSGPRRGVTSSIAGFAFSAICGAMLLHLLDDRCMS
jgi:hypothetical protein